MENVGYLLFLLFTWRSVLCQSRIPSFDPHFICHLHTTCFLQVKDFIVGGVLRGSVVKCLTLKPGVLGSNHAGSSGVFCGSVLGQNTSEPQPSTGETQEDMNNVSCRRDMTEILLKAA